MAALKEQKLEMATRTLIAETVREILEDPDFGLELSERAKRRLSQSRHSKKTVPLSEIKRKYL